jgi:hypothetical protein
MHYKFTETSYENALIELFVGELVYAYLPVERIIAISGAKKERISKR